MTEWDATEQVMAAVAALPEATYTVHTGQTWVAVAPTGVPMARHGWKLHVSSRAVSFPELAARLVPVLLARGCHFKLARSTEVLARINDGQLGPATVGKAVTVYPDQATVRELGLALAGLLRGHEGPRVLSDRPVADDAPVFYRYGPFSPHWRMDESGNLTIAIPGADGSLFDGLATLEYRRPAWATDPFTGETGPPDDGSGGPGDEEPLAGRYRITRGIVRAARGNVYRATDVHTGQAVIVKQARAHTSESEGVDSRMRLRNERRVLIACKGVLGVPAFVDHFAYGPDEYLVTTDVGRSSLLGQPGALGIHPRDSDVHDAPTGLVQLAADLARTLLALHDRGVIMRDVTPPNVILGEDRAYLVDFGISALDGFHLPGGTPGFAPPRQLAGEPPVPEDDGHALGMVLAFAATGMRPVSAADLELVRRRVLQALTAAWGDTCPALIDIVADLLSGDPDTTGHALRVLAAGEWTDRSAARRARPPVVLPSAAQVDTERLERYLLERLLAQVSEYHFEGSESDIGAVDACVYTGSAGVGLELLHHRHRQGVPEMLRRLAAHAAAATRRVALPPGLLTGATGVELFLARMAAAGFGVQEATPAADGPADPSDEVMAGLAGIGLGELLLYDHRRDAERLDAARVLAERLIARPERRWVVEPDNGQPPEAGVDATCGYAHGLAGVVDFLVGVAARSGDEELATAAHKHAHQLASQIPDRAAAAAAATATPLTASWCQGLAGPVRALVHAATYLDDPDLGQAARTAAAACATWLPRMENLSQCCGVTGVGSALLEIAIVSGDERLWSAARRAARQLLIRSHGPDDQPVLIDPQGQDAAVSWGMGGIGILAFLRRLNRPDTPDLLPGTAPPKATGSSTAGAAHRP